MLDIIEPSIFLPYTTFIFVKGRVDKRWKQRKQLLVFPVIFGYANKTQKNKSVHQSLR